jgi:hypothetical protein
LIGVYAILKLHNAGSKHLRLYKILVAFITLASLAGFFMMIKFDAIFSIVRYAYTLFDIAVVGTIVVSSIFFIQQQFENLAKKSAKGHDAIHPV